MGRNFPFYPPGSQVVGIDLSPAMLACAQRQRETAAAAVELRQMDVTQLDFPDRSFDAAVATLLFWILLGAAMRELRRVVKPGGVIRCLEYDQSGRRIRRTCQIFELPEGQWWRAVSL
jgi:ubiquinone/menaquinone biosynthesis C-methylase UbiE